MRHTNVCSLFITECGFIRGPRHKSERALSLAHTWLPVKQYLITNEQLVDLLEREILGLWVEEPDQWVECGVEDGEVDIRLPFDTVDRDRRDLDYEEGEDPV